MIKDAFKERDLDSYFSKKRTYIDRAWANPLVSVQPMSYPAGVIFYLDFLVNTEKEKTEGELLAEFFSRSSHDGFECWPPKSVKIETKIVEKFVCPVCSDHITEGFPHNHGVE